MKKKLLILDLKKNYNIKRNNVDVIYLSYGDIHIVNSSRLDLEQYRNEKIKKELLNFLIHYVNFAKINQKNFDVSELEILNIRNDKSNIFDHLLNLSIIKKNLIKLYETVEIIFDHRDYDECYNSFLNKKTKIINLNKKNKTKINFLSFVSKRLLFFLRALIIVFLSKKLFKLKNNKVLTINMSIFPLLQNRNIYPKNLYNLNFLITDETHLNLNLYQKIKTIFILSNNHKIISTEQFISFPDLLSNFILTFKFKKIVDHYFSTNYFFNGVNVGSALNHLLIISILNRLKLSIYNNSLVKIFNKFNFKKINYFMFEYSFGFYLSNQLKKINKRIFLSGYQHGIYSKNLMFFNYLKFKKIIKNYSPHAIVATNIYSYADYLLTFKNKKTIKLNKDFFNSLNDELPIINVNSKRILVILGQHDCFDLIQYFLNNKKYNNFFIFFKFHPGTNQKLFKDLKIKTIKKINKSNFNKIFISQTSTLLYYYRINKIKFHIVKFNYRYDICNSKLFIVDK